MPPISNTELAVPMEDCGFVGVASIAVLDVDDILFAIVQSVDLATGSPLENTLDPVGADEFIDLLEAFVDAAAYVTR